VRQVGDILSQKEIDELINSYNSGEIDAKQIQKTSEKKIKKFDFMRPSKFAKEHLRTLELIHENYARMVTSYLSGYLRTNVHVEVQSVQPLSYFEFTSSIPDPTVLALVDFAPLNGSLIFDLSPQVAFAIIDRILGGGCNSIGKIRDFTEIELAIIERTMIQMVNLVREPWDNIISIKPRLEKIGTNSQFLKYINENEMVALVTLSIRTGNVEGMLNICIPHMVVEPIIPKLSPRMWYSEIKKETSVETKKTLENNINKIKVPVKAILGATTISVSDFLDLQPGDVIPLDAPIDGDIKVKVGNLLKFYGKPGVKKNKVAVKITSVIKEEDD